MRKIAIYQILTRLYGNTNRTKRKHGTIEENGCGKMNDINEVALNSIASMGFSYVWYTGIIRHASTTNYSYISHPANANVVKGKAGSPYAICDYYDVDPDLAVDVDAREEEFLSLVDRTHTAGLKVIIDFVPNHVARNYFSDKEPQRPMLGQEDCPEWHFAQNNNFYYMVGQTFSSPEKGLDVEYVENPAKASGNDAFTATPSRNDWYETVKLNYGIDYRDGSCHFAPIPNTWYKMRDILLFWSSKGIDGFRVDMAEMVPVEFWRWVIGQINMRYPHIIFIAETYDLNKYRDYIEAGFNLLYDKVNFYDTVRDVITGTKPALELTNIWRRTEGLVSNMLYFLENHDEQRLASDFFAGNAIYGKPAMMLTVLMNRASFMVYFGQELGVRGMDEEGFSGLDGRTTIFDYWGVEEVQDFVGSHTYDEMNLSAETSQLRAWYGALLNMVKDSKALSYGEFYDLMWVNRHLDASSIYAFLRYNESERYLIVLNFGSKQADVSVLIPDDAWAMMGEKGKTIIETKIESHDGIVVKV